MEPSNRKSLSHCKLNEGETKTFLSANEDSDTDIDIIKPKINCDNRKLLLKKNLSWTTPHQQRSSENLNIGGTGNLIEKQNLKISRSNPLVLEATESLTTHVKNLTNAKLKLFSNNTHSINNQENLEQSLQLQPPINKLAPLAKAISTTSTLTAVTTNNNQNLQPAATTPTAINTIQFKQRNSICYLIRTILNHFKACYT
jgi:hypothetical protein